MSEKTPETQPNIQPAEQAENKPELSGRQLLLQEIGSKLNQARQAKNEQISKAVRQLKIPINHLQALESGHWDALPDDVYVIGFLRQYSNYLGIDLANEINRLKNSDYTLTRPLTFPDPPVAPSRRWAWLTGSAFVVLFIAFNIVNHNDENLAPTAVDQTEQSTTQAANSTSPETSGRNQLNEKQATPPAQQTQLKDISTTASRAVSSPPAQIAKVRTKKPNPIAIADTVPVQKQQTQQQKTQQKTKARMHSFRFEAVTAPVWLQLFAPNRAGTGKGHLLKELLLKKGQHATIRHATESLWITCGNALALRIRVDQKIIVKTGSLGSGKKILRDYRFNIKAY